VVVSARLEGIDLGTGVKAVQKAVNDLKMPPSIRVEYAGTYKEQQKSFRDLLTVLLLALVLVFVVLLLEFRAFSAPLAILSSAVLSTSGVFFALLITRTTFNVSSFMGLIMVIGIVAKNGILLLDANQKFRSVGFSAEEALVQAGRRRLRPIVMTAMAAVAGMLPLSLALGAGSQMLQPLAIAVIGGILISMILSLVITPAMGPGFIEGLPVGKFHGVGPVTAAKMNSLGIGTGADLRCQSIAFLQRHFGKSGAWYYAIARGEDDRPVVPDRPRKSSGSETTFADDLTDPIAIEAGVQAMADDVWAWCEKAQAFGHTVTVKIKFADFRQATRSRTLSAPVGSQALLLETSIALVRLVYPLTIGIRLVGVTVSNFRGQVPVRQLNLTLSDGPAVEAPFSRCTDERRADDV